MFIKVLLILLFSSTILFSAENKLSKSDLLIKKVIKAYGGVENIKKVKSSYLLSIKTKLYDKKVNLKHVFFQNVDKEIVTHICNYNVFFTYSKSEECHVINTTKAVKCDKVLTRIMELGYFTIDLMKFYTLKNKNYKIKYLGKSKINGKEVEGIRVTEKKLKLWIELYFDIETFFLYMEKKGDKLGIYKPDLSESHVILSNVQKIGGSFIEKTSKSYKLNKLTEESSFTNLVSLKKNQYSFPKTKNHTGFLNAPLSKEMIRRCEEIK